VWIWVAIPVPTSESSINALNSVILSLFKKGTSEKLPTAKEPLDVSFLFFLFWYYGEPER
jgi:hypothetical protein